MTRSIVPRYADTVKNWSDTNPETVRGRSIYHDADMPRHQVNKLLFEANGDVDALRKALVRGNYVETMFRLQRNRINVLESTVSELTRRMKGALRL